MYSCHDNDNDFALLFFVCASIVCSNNVYVPRVNVFYFCVLTY